MAQIKRIKVGMASCGLAAGAQAVYDELKKIAGDIPVVGVGCIGHCYCEPIVEVETDSEPVFYSRVQGTAETAQKILSLSEDGRFEVPALRKKNEMVFVTKLAGRIVPCDIEEYKEMFEK